MRVGSRGVVNEVGALAMVGAVLGLAGCSPAPSAERAGAPDPDAAPPTTPRGPAGHVSDAGTCPEHRIRCRSVCLERVGDEGDGCRLIDTGLGGRATPALLVEEDRVYYSGGTDVRLHVPSLRTTRVLTDLPTWGPLAMDGELLYTGAGSEGEYGVVSVGLEDGSVAPLVTGLSGVSLLELSNGVLWFFDDIWGYGTLHRHDLADGLTTTFALGAGGGSLASDGDSLYLHALPPLGPVQESLLRMPLDGSAAPASLGADLWAWPGAIQVDGDFVYWTEAGIGNGHLKRIPREGGPTETLVDTYNLHQILGFDGSSVYVLAQGGDADGSFIDRVSKETGAVERVVNVHPMARPFDGMSVQGGVVFVFVQAAAGLALLEVSLTSP